MGEEDQAEENNKIEEKPAEIQSEPQITPESIQNPEPVAPKPVETYANTQYTAPQEQYSVPQPQVNIQKANFAPLSQSAVEGVPQNIDLILDVPLEISVVLGKTKKSIKEVLDLGTGSLIELDKLAEEPVEIYVNGKKIAYGEVVVVDENFGVRIVSIVSGEERVKSLRG